MAKARPSVQKRNKETKVHEKKLAKAVRKANRDAERGDRPDVDDGVDPDLIGLTPGPQVIPWHDEDDGQ